MASYRVMLSRRIIQKAYVVVEAESLDAAKGQIDEKYFSGGDCTYDDGSLKWEDVDDEADVEDAELWPHE